MKTTLTVAALALAIAAPAFAQDAKPAVTPPVAPMAKPAETPKAQPAASKETAAQPAAKTDAKSDNKAGDNKDAKKVDQKASAPTVPAAAPQRRQDRRGQDRRGPAGQQDHREARRDQEAVTGRVPTRRLGGEAPAIPPPGPCCVLSWLSHRLRATIRLDFPACPQL